jgi:hypothetical protein
MRMGLNNFASEIQRTNPIKLNIGAVPGTLSIFCNFSYDTYIIFPRDFLLLGIPSS